MGKLALGLPSLAWEESGVAAATWSGRRASFCLTVEGVGCEGAGLGVSLLNICLYVSFRVHAGTSVAGLGLLCVFVGVWVACPGPGGEGPAGAGVEVFHSLSPGIGGPESGWLVSLGRGHRLRRPWCVCVWVAGEGGGQGHLMGFTPLGMGLRCWWEAVILGIMHGVLDSGSQAGGPRSTQAEGWPVAVATWLRGGHSDGNLLALILLGLFSGGPSPDVTGSPPEVP